jgi:cation transport ATPase
MTIAIEGMHSAACEKRVRMALQQIAGLQVREVTMGSAVVDGNAEQRAAALKAIERAGYQPHLEA